jgi:hypothetical protein
MKAHYKTARITFEMEADNPKALWKKIALVQEIFDTDRKCGCCQSENIRFRSRQVDDFEFFELGCIDCHARLQFGQNKKGGGLFAKRRDEDGNYLPDNGWSVYKPKTTSEPTQRTNAKDDLVDDDVPF